EGTDPSINNSQVIQFRATNTDSDYGLNLLRCTNLDARKTALLEALDTLPPAAGIRRLLDIAGQRIREWRDRTEAALKNPSTRRMAISAVAILAAILVFVYVRVGQLSPPPPIPSGRLELTVAPWARVESIVNLKTGRESLTQILETP